MGWAAVASRAARRAAVAGGAPPEIDAVRRFNRFYTRRIGLLNRGFLDSRLSLTDVRVLYELSRRPSVTAADIARELGLDTGYLSRLLNRLSEDGIVSRQRSAEDGRQSLLALTAHGRTLFDRLEKRQVAAVAALLDPLAPSARRGLIASMRTIESLMGERAEVREPNLLRPPRPGDLGVVVHRQGRLYNEEYGWDMTFEALLARIVADFVDHFDPKREACWIAERAREIVGSIFCVRETDDVARLRMLYVEPWCRGLGIGGRLVEECMSFARRSGYKQMTLWTNDVLTAARRIYERAGFRLVSQERHHSYGHDLVAQTWQTDL